MQQMQPARAAFESGDEPMKERRDVFYGAFADTWCDWAIADLLRIEAAKVLKLSTNHSTD
ncbi:hypothetical protein D3C83_284200 [compost metagenome]